MNIKGIGARVKARREELDLPRLYLARKLGMEHDAYARLEEGETDPDLETLVQLCLILHTTPDALLGWNER